MKPPKLGSRYDGRLVLEVHPYTGRYPQWFTHVLVLTSPYTCSGTISMAWGPST